jgi:hypothetical protein
MDGCVAEAGTEALESCGALSHEGDGGCLAYLLEVPADFGWRA